MEVQTFFKYIRNEVRTYILKDDFFFLEKESNNKVPTK